MADASCLRESHGFRPGTPHSLKNSRGESIQLINTHLPALRFEDMFRDLHALINVGKIKRLPPNDPRSVLHTAMLFAKYIHELGVIKPPNAVFKILARLGRTLGLTLDGLDREAKALSASRGGWVRVDLRPAKRLPRNGLKPRSGALLGGVEHPRLDRLVGQAKAGFDVVHRGRQFGDEFGEKRVVVHFAAEYRPAARVRGCAVDAQDGRAGWYCEQLGLGLGGADRGDRLRRAAELDTELLGERAMLERTG